MGRREDPPPPVVPVVLGVWTTSGGGRGGILWAMAAMPATRDDIDANMDNQRAPYKPPDLSHCNTSNLKVPGGHREVMRSDYARLWEDSARQKFYGLLDAGTFEAV